MKLRCFPPVKLVSALISLITVSIVGCRTSQLSPESFNVPSAMQEQLLTRPEIDDSSISIAADRFARPTTKRELPAEFQDISLEESIRVALTNREVVAGLGGQILANSDAVPGIFDPAIQATHPVYGVQAALAPFDAKYSSGLSFQRNDNVFNNTFNGGGANEVQQKLINYQSSLSKTSITGATFSLNHNTISDNNNAPNNLFDNSWSTNWELQTRQPLLQGAGTQFNRIAGPNAQPGFQFSRGLLIGQANYDISVAQFEQGLHRFVDEMVSKYWQLQIAYHQYETLREAKEGSLKLWNATKSRMDQGLRGGSADREAQAREQYYNYESQLLTALNGDAVSGQAGVFKTEAELRRLMGLPMSDGRLLRPSDVPSKTGVVFDWDYLINEALKTRPECRGQVYKIKQRELELIASKNFLLPRLDAVSTFRKNGFGDDLIGGGPGRFSSAYKDLASGNHDEWEMGLQLQVPIGFRQASSGVRHAELNLMRERAVLREQEQQIALDLGNAFRQIDPSLENAELAYHRMEAAIQSVAALQASFDAGIGSFFELLEAQRRVTETELAYHTAVANIELATAAVHRESGRLLVEYDVVLTQ